MYERGLCQRLHILSVAYPYQRSRMDCGTLCGVNVGIKQEFRIFTTVITFRTTV